MFLIKNKFLIKIFFRIYKKWLFCDFTGTYSEIKYITGWRNLIIETPTGQRLRISPCFLLWQ